MGTRNFSLKTDLLIYTCLMTGTGIGAGIFLSVMGTILYFLGATPVLMGLILAFFIPALCITAVAFAWARHRLMKPGYKNLLWFVSTIVFNTAIMTILTPMALLVVLVASPFLLCDPSGCA